MALLFSLPRADDDGVLGVHDEPYVPLGSCYMDAETGYTWQYLKAAVDLAQGEAVSPSTNLHTLDNVDVATAAGSRELVDNGSNFLTSLVRVEKTSRQKEFALIQVVSGTGNGQSGIIHEIQKTKLLIEWISSDGSLKTALDTTSDVAISAPWLAKKAASDIAVLGFVQQPNGVSQDEYFWALFCGQGLAKAGAAITAGAALTAHSTAGTVDVKGDAADFNIGTALFAAAANDLFLVSIKATLLIGEVPIKTDIGYQASTVAPTV